MLSAVLAAALLAGGTIGQGPQVAPALATADAPIVAEAQRFMTNYARDLIAGDRTAVSNRYDRRGAHLVIGRQPRLESHAAIAAIYAGPGWNALPRFAWHDLMYIPAGPDSVVVAGRFSVQPDGAPAPIFYSYSNLLVRQEGELRIRMEHETPEPAPR